MATPTTIQPVRAAEMQPVATDQGQSGGEGRAHVTAREVAIVGIALTAVALLLRLPLLGSTFSSSDNASLAARIVWWPGYWWMIYEDYGLLINLVVKFGAGLVSLLGIHVTEFWWKFPIALIGALQPLVTYVFLRRFQGSRAGALFGGATVAVLPIHVMQSRYLWGYEVLGTLFITLALWALLRFFESPDRKSAFIASVAAGLYLISHGYIVPFALCVGLAAWFYGRDARAGVRRFISGVRLMWMRFLWVGPGLFFPLYMDSLEHSASKPSEPGFYLVQHGGDWLGASGWPLAILCLLGLATSFRMEGSRGRLARFLGLCGMAYLLPLFVLTPPGITVVRGYMLVGIYLWILCGAIVIGELAENHGRLVLVVGLVCVVLTTWGTAETIFARDELPDPAYVTPGRGLPTADPGTKAAGYLVQEYVQPDEKVLAVHEAVEIPNLIYYFRRQKRAFYDLQPSESCYALQKFLEQADVVICGAPHVDLMDKEKHFHQKAVLRSEGESRMWIYARPGTEIPEGKFQVEELNKRFDGKFAWEVHLL